MYMAGICIAIFTFLLVLFFSPHPEIAINPYLFQATLGEIIVAVFAFSISALYNFVLVYSRPAKHPEVPSHETRATLFFAAGLLLLLLEPSLILFSIDLILVAIPALILFLIYVALYMKADSTIRKILSSTR